MLFEIGDYVLVISTDDADGIDTDDMNSHLGHVGVVLDTDPIVEGGEPLHCVRFPGTGSFEPFGEEIHHVKGEQCFTHMTFWAKDLQLVSRPKQAITKHCFEEGGL